MHDHSSVFTSQVHVLETANDAPLLHYCIIQRTRIFQVDGSVGVHSSTLCNGHIASGGYTQ